MNGVESTTREFSRFSCIMVHLADEQARYDAESRMNSKQILQINRVFVKGRNFENFHLQWIWGSMTPLEQ
jgi:hypothetical protein